MYYFNIIILNYFIIILTRTYVSLGTVHSKKDLINIIVWNIHF